MAARGKNPPGTFNAYPLVPFDEPDYEDWAIAWCASKGWDLIEVQGQTRNRQKDPTHCVLKVLVQEARAA
jgi:hypothetical protein